MLLEANHVNPLYRKVLMQVMAGEAAAPRGMQTREVRGVQLVLRQPAGNLLYSPARKLNYAFSVAEWLWILLGQNDAASIVPFNRQLAKFSDDGVRFNGAYGPKFVEQLPYVLQALKSDRHSRQALLTIWRERPGKTLDVPCTVAMQFFIRHDALEMLVYMRSNDAWLGLPYDLFNFTQIQNYVAGLLDVDLGPYRHVVGSLHVYEPHFEKAYEVIGETGPVPNYWSHRLRGEMPALVRPAFNAIAVQAAVAADAPLPQPWHTYMDLLTNYKNPSVALPAPFHHLKYGGAA